MKLRIALIVSFFIAGYFSFSYANEFVSLDELIKEALSSNPKIKAAKEIWQAEQERVKEVTALPDPMFMYGFFGKNIETRAGPQKQNFSRSQKIPFPGKLSLKGKAQEEKAKTAEEMYEATKREVIKNLKIVFLDLYWIDRAIEITEREKNILIDSSSTLRRKYEANLMPQRDVLKVEVEISNLIDKLLLLRQQRNTTAAKINSIVSRPHNYSLGKVKDIDIKAMDFNTEELFKIGTASRQEIKALKHKVDKSKFDKTLAKFDFLPDFTFGFNYIDVEAGHTTQPNDGEDAWLATISINLPIWENKLNAQVREKEAMLRAADADLESKNDEVDYEVSDLYFKLITYKDIINLYETTLIPQANQAYESVKTAYESGKTDFLNWLDSERTLLKIRLAYYKAKADYAKNFALLERAIGEDL